jgi:SagB-type dehydrogenase family enzyme
LNKSKVFLIFLLGLFIKPHAQELTPLKLNDPDKSRGLAVMQALAVRASVREYSEQKLSLQDLSDLLWAANGVNRPEEGKRTAPSAMNAQDCEIYVFLEEGIYLYNAFDQLLTPLRSGDYRPLTGVADAPVGLVLVSDISKFPSGEDSLKTTWAAIDAGVVSQNISLFCAATGLKTCPRAGLEREKIQEILALKSTQYIMLNHPVGYEKNK